uniref:CSLREA domain-containing protein n=1 Tax=Thermorudis peleae TaxID=1382356 RepID=A0A831TH95_9BACT
MIGRLGLLRAGLLLFSLALGAGGTLLFLSSQTEAVDVTFDVTEVSDAVDANPGDGVCDTGTGVCTLRAAIQEANALSDNVVIELPSGTYELSLTGAGEDNGGQGDLDVTKTRGTLTISGSSAADTLVTWQAVPGDDRILDIHDGAEVEVVQVTLSGGAPPDGDGGAIRNAGTLELTDVVVQQSQAPRRGGGIFNSGTLRLATNRTGTLIQNNQAGTDGGGIANAQGATAELHRVTVQGNSTVQDGGGIFNQGTLVIGDASLIGGASQALGNSAGRNGGGIAHADGSLTVTGATIQWNVAGTAPEGGSGGGVWADPGVQPDLRNVTVADNQATAGGGIAAGKLVLTDSTLQRNRAETDGGGLLVLSSGNARVIGGTIVDNAASNGDGGGIANQATLTLSRVSIQRNQAASRVGGGIFNASSATLTADNQTVVESNRAASGGGLANAGTAALNGVRVLTNTASGNGGGIENSGSLSLQGAVVSDNSAGQHGGGVYHTGSQAIEIERGAFLSGNRAQLDGGGIFAAGPVEITDSQIQGNGAGQRGGGILTQGQLTIERSVVIDNVAGLDGGGLYLAGGTDGTATDSAVRRNQAQTGVGGGIAIASDASLTLAYTSLTENQAGLYGGGIGILGAVEATNVTISTNAGGQRGGGIWVGPASQATLQFVTLAANGASAGGALYNDSGQVSLLGVLIASSPGGGNCGGIAPESEGGNLEDRNSCLLDGEGDLVNADPDLQPLQSEAGGLTFFHPLGTGSQAIDQGPDGECPEDDQRHQPRPQGAACDIGAYELLAASLPTATPTPTQTPTVTVTPSVTPAVTPSAQATPTGSPTARPSPVVPTVAPWSTPTPSITLPNTGSSSGEGVDRRGLGLGMMAIGGFGVALTLVTLVVPVSPRRRASD